MNNENRNSSNGKKLKYKYLDKSLNHSLNKAYYSPERRERSFAYGRRSTIEDFSPYRNIEYEHGRIKNNLIEEIAMQNQLLNNQLLEYRAIVARLEESNFQKDQRIVFLENEVAKGHSMYESIIAEMKEEIKLVLSKNVVLEG